ncbi:MAG TPA: glucans biosynthesis glucosyltransferase MdoH [Nitrospirales bacterium]|nr:glucans biosynthesis glucosyltransferase MdoH [Nitrospirales bacterium]
MKIREATFDEAHRPLATPRRVSWRLAAGLRRALLSGLVLAQSFLAASYMTAILPYHGGNMVEMAIIGLFFVLFAWISVGFWIGMFGFILRCFRGDRLSPLGRHTAAELSTQPLSRTAIVMPIYHEPIQRTFGGIRAMYRSLEQTGQIDHFDFFILSDSRNPDVWLAEQAAWHQLCKELGAGGHLFYRRRSLNQHYKSGNIADFLRRWGSGYEYMIVLDADSLMGGSTLVTMVQLMQAEPQTGILQTSPTLINARSMFARVQQFANHIYGPLFTTGLASLQLGEAVYWGHNAIIRTRAFMEHGGLRRLPGPGLFHGPILSHDFVEAAFMGRGGYEVWLEPDLSHSYEESPPTLVDDLQRDKRWAKGNLQHIWLMLFEPGLRPAHRMAFLNGIMSYLASPLWLIFLVLTTIEAARLVLYPINYFPEPYSLFPHWPEWNPEWAIMLASSTLFLLFLPKILSVIDVIRCRRAKQHGGIIRLLSSVLLEILVSTLLAPIRMLAHSRFVLEALLNTSLRWAGQNRTDETGWSAAILNQAPGTIIAGAWAAFAYWLDQMFFFWSLPVAAPLVFAAPTSVFLSRVGPGERLKRWRLLQVPEERHGSQLLDDVYARTYPLLETYTERSSPAIQAILDPVLNQVHQAMAHAHRGGKKQEMILALRQRCFQYGPHTLTQKELCHLVRDRASLQWLHEQAWQAPPDSYWGKALHHHFQH